MNRATRCRNAAATATGASGSYDLVHAVRLEDQLGV